MKNSKQYDTNIFNEASDYAKQGFWISFRDRDTLSDFRDLCSSEKAEIDLEASRNSRNSGDERVVFKKYVHRTKLLFILYLMKLWSPEGQAPEPVISEEDKVGMEFWN